ncbi:MAG: hypothetical protein GVY11_04185 [Gammaproteobacteria bacterium]|jgi:hypothetical protein|nr:hypothetical protein [Gammaproteobacteria bacterium]
MKTKRLLAITAGLLLASGCATLHSPSGKSGPSHYDADYVGTVNAIARDRGTKVIWVNPPKAGEEKHARG